MGSPGPLMEVRCLLNQYCHSGGFATQFGHVRPVVHADGQNDRRVRHRRVTAHRGDVVARRRAARCGAGLFESLGAQRQQPGHRRRQSGGGVAEVEDLLPEDQAGPRTSVAQGEAGQPHRCSPDGAQLACALKASQCFVAWRAEKAPMSSTAPNRMAPMPMSTTSAVKGAPGWRMHRKPSATAMMPRIR